MKLTISTKSIDKGIVYVLVIYIEDQTLVKIGITSGKVEDRVAAILKSMWTRYREFPRCVVKRFRSVTCPEQEEKALHDHFKEYRYTTQFKFSGSTEFFLVDVEDVVKVYDERIPKC